MQSTRPIVNRANTVALLWPQGNTRAQVWRPLRGTEPERVAEKVQQLSPQTESQRSIQSQALQMSGDLQLFRWRRGEKGSRKMIFCKRL